MNDEPVSVLWVDAVGATSHGHQIPIRSFTLLLLILMAMNLVQVVDFPNRWHLF